MLDRYGLAAGFLAIWLATIGAALRGDALELAGSALLGSYTTFSTWMLESHRLAEDAKLPLAAFNVALSLLAGVGAAVLGRVIGAQL